jgi:hypothetical protein
VVKYRGMQPIADTPPVPYGRVAVDAWRELDRETRRELLRSDRPHPDPAVAVVAVGYAREVLSRSPLRQVLPFALATGAVFAILFIVIQAVGMFSRAELNLVYTIALIVIVLLALLKRIQLSRWSIAMHRMERLNAARLWSTERTGPTVAPHDGTTVVVRYRRGARVPAFGVLGVLVAAVEALVWWSGVAALALAVTGLLAVFLGIVIYLDRFRVRPHLPMLIMNAAGMEIPAMGARLAWSDLAELQIHPFRARQVGMRTGHSVAFVLTDPGALTSQLKGWWAKRARTPLKVFGTPLVIADGFLDHTAEQIAATAASFTGAPIRRFGP